MSQHLLIDLERARACVSLLMSLGAKVQAARVHHQYGAAITVGDPGALADHLDARQTPVFCTDSARCAVVENCLVTWSAR
jgi:hypothetical protein